MRDRYGFLGDTKGDYQAISVLNLTKDITDRKEDRSLLSMPEIRELRDLILEWFLSS